MVLIRRPRATEGVSVACRVASKTPTTGPLGPVTPARRPTGGVGVPIVVPPVAPSKVLPVPSGTLLLGATLTAPFLRLADGTPPGAAPSEDNVRGGGARALVVVRGAGPTADVVHRRTFSSVDTLVPTLQAPIAKVGPAGTPARRLGPPIEVATEVAGRRPLVVTGGLLVVHAKEARGPGTPNAVERPPLEGPSTKVGPVPDVALVATALAAALRPIVATPNALDGGVGLPRVAGRGTRPCPRLPCAFRVALPQVVALPAAVRRGRTATARTCPWAAWPPGTPLASWTALASRATCPPRPARPTPLRAGPRPTGRPFAY